MRSTARSCRPSPASAAGPLPGGPGEGLGDVQPARRRRRPRPAGRGRRGARRWVTSRQKSSAGPVTRWAASVGPVRPHRAVGRGELDAELLGGRRSSPCTREGEVAGADAEAGDVPQPGGGRARRTPSASATSWPCAQVSISRAVAIDGGAHRRPVPGELRARRRARRAPRSEPRAAGPPVRRAAARAACAAPASAPSSTKPSRARRAPPATSRRSPPGR